MKNLAADIQRLKERVYQGGIPYGIRMIAGLFLSPSFYTVVIFRFGQWAILQPKAVKFVMRTLHTLIVKDIPDNAALAPAPFIEIKKSSGINNA